MSLWAAAADQRLITCSFTLLLAPASVIYTTPEFMCEKDHKTRVKDINFITYYLLLWRFSVRSRTERKII
jgi:hypothetical protein